MERNFKMLLVYSIDKTARLDYILDQVLSNFLGLEWQFTQDAKEFLAYAGSKFNYSNTRLGKEIWFQPYGLLNENGIDEPQPDCFLWKALPVFFKVDESAALPFDIFSLVFYLITRYEEYGHKVKYDLHGRYIPQQSIAYKNKFLGIPLVDVLIVQLKLVLGSKYPMLNFKKNNYQYLPTFDIDVLFAHKAKPFWRLLGGSFRNLLSLKFDLLKKRISVFKGKEKDPFDNFDELLSGTKHMCDQPLAFINFGRYSTFDKNNSISNPLVSDFLKHLNSRFKPALHPSYRSNDSKRELKSEVLRFKKIYASKPLQSRQHFIRLSFPYTYQDLIDIGIKEDYSMGYPSHIGFRASTSFPFYFYDLTKEEKTALKVYPFAFMDGTLFDYLKLSNEKALTLVEKTAILVQKVGGVMIGIWHNSFIADDPLRMNFFNELTEKLKPKS